jgi:hypothetical protein
MWGPLLVLISLVLLSPSPTAAQAYQDSSDGLVSVHIRMIEQQGRPVAFDACARLLRQADAGPLEIRLNLRGESGGIAAQVPVVVVPAGSAPVCRRVWLPGRLWSRGRWEIARLRFRHDQSLQARGRPPGAG